MPATRPVVTRLGNISAVMNRESAAMPAGTTDRAARPDTDRDRDGLGRRGVFRIARIRSCSELIDPPHPMRSAITVAGIVGCSESSALIFGSTALIAHSTDDR
ncbi:hypothetical protein [Rhodococcus sp. D-1]|uniref:hypothetical protein n=1 Tax=Rhodococcus sp. D-1 TaxID=1912238 RepID=UPI0015C32171|nr:hypothetical protein [Rhodococcus sp. D-1]